MSLIYVISYTTPFGSRSTMLVDNDHTLVKAMSALSAAGCEQVDFDHRSISSSPEALDRILNMSWAEGVTTEKIKAAWDKED